VNQETVIFPKILEVVIFKNSIDVIQIGRGGGFLGKERILYELLLHFV
jgi:hypothetical protein